MMGKRVVIVDDERDIVEYLIVLLKDNGFEPYTAANSAEGLVLIKRLRPELICLDILMPGQSGISLFQEIKKDKDLAKIPTIIISGLNLAKELGEKESALKDIKPDLYIEKPIAPSVFIEAVRKLLQ